MSAYINGTRVKINDIDTVFTQNNIGTVSDNLLRAIEKEASIQSLTNTEKVRFNEILKDKSIRPKVTTSNKMLLFFFMLILFGLPLGISLYTHFYYISIITVLFFTVMFTLIYGHNKKQRKLYSTLSENFNNGKYISFMITVTKLVWFDRIVDDDSNSETVNSYFINCGKYDGLYLRTDYNTYKDLHDGDKMIVVIIRLDEKMHIELIKTPNNENHLL